MADTGLGCLTNSAGFGLGCWTGFGGSKTFLAGTGLGCLTDSAGFGLGCWTGFGGSKTFLAGTVLGCLTGWTGLGGSCLTDAALGCLTGWTDLGGSCLIDTALGCLTGWAGLGSSCLTGAGLGCLNSWTGLGGSCLTGAGLGFLTGSAGFELGCLTTCAAGVGLTCLVLPKKALGGSCLAADIAVGGLAGSCLTDDITADLGGPSFATCTEDLGVYWPTADTAGGLGVSDFASRATGGCFSVPRGLGGSCFTVEVCVGWALLWFHDAATTAGLEVGCLAAEVLLSVGAWEAENGALATDAQGG